MSHKTYRMINPVFLFTFVIVALSLSGCSETVPAYYDEYAYTEPLCRYFKEVFGKENFLAQHEKVFVLPLNSCSPCLETTLNYLIEHAQYTNIGTVVVGKAKKEKHARLVEALSDKADLVLIDEKEKLAGYETNIFGPALIQRAGRKYYQVNLSDEIWKKLKKDLR